MNRAARRRLEKKGIDKQDVMTLYNSAVKEGIRQAVEGYSVAVAMTLRDKWGFGKVRLERFLDQTQELFDSIDEGYLNIDDCEKALLEECGIEFK